MTGEASTSSGTGGRSLGRRGLAGRSLALVGIALLVALGLGELVLDRVQRSGVPSREDWEAAAAAVRQAHRPGDLIVTAPQWADPLGRLVLGDLLTMDDVTRPDAAAYGTIFQLSVGEARHPDTRGAKVSWRRAFGRITATRYQRTPARITTDFYQDLPRAQVWEEAGGRAAPPCPWDARRARFLCGPTWKSVRAIRAEVGYSARRCIFAHPIDGAARVIQYRDVDPGERMVIYTGFAGYDPRYRARRAVWEYGQWKRGRIKRDRPPVPVAPVPVTLAVTVNGQPAGRVHHDIDDESFRRTVIQVPGGAPGAQVRFTVTTRHAWSKNFCFYARAEGGTP